MQAKSEVVRLERINDDAYRMRLELEGESMRELVASIRRDGVIVPVVLERTEDGFNVVAGHRRVAAARVAGLGHIPAQVVESGSENVWAIAFAENLFRQDLSPIEEAASVVDLMDKGGKTAEEVVSIVGRSVRWVRERVVIASWPGDIAAAVHGGVISCSAAWNLAEISDDGPRSTLLAYAIENGATARTTAAWLAAWRSSGDTVEPETVEVPAGAPPVAPIEPYAPCLLCDRKLKMIDLRYQPICAECTPTLIDLGRELRARAGGEGPGV